MNFHISDQLSTRQNSQTQQSIQQFQDYQQLMLRQNSIFQFSNLNRQQAFSMFDFRNIPSLYSNEMKKEQRKKLLKQRQMQEAFSKLLQKKIEPYQTFVALRHKKKEEKLKFTYKGFLLTIFREILQFCDQNNQKQLKNLTLSLLSKYARRSHLDDIEKQISFQKKINCSLSKITFCLSYIKSQYLNLYNKTINFEEFIENLVKCIKESKHFFIDSSQNFNNPKEIINYLFNSILLQVFPKKKKGIFNSLHQVSLAKLKFLKERKYFNSKLFLFHFFKDFNLNFQLISPQIGLEKTIFRENFKFWIIDVTQYQESVSNDGIQVQNQDFLENEGKDQTETLLVIQEKFVQILLQLLPKISNISEQKQQKQFLYQYIENFKQQFPEENNDLNKKLPIPRIILKQALFFFIEQDKIMKQHIVQPIWYFQVEKWQFQITELSQRIRKAETNLYQLKKHLNDPEKINNEQFQLPVQQNFKNQKKTLIKQIRDVKNEINKLIIWKPFIENKKKKIDAKLIQIQNAIKAIEISQDARKNISINQEYNQNQQDLSLSLNSSQSSK